jgi:Spy/CpxP family protein refolding chaperone
MKKLIVAVLLVVGLSTFAQVEKKEKAIKEPIEKMSPAEKAENGLKRMTKQLKLTEVQQKQMKILMAEQEAKRADANFKPSKEDRLAMKEKISKILTPEQNATWDKIQEEKKEKMKHKIKEKKEKAGKTEDK